MEVALQRPGGTASSAPDLLWRVRLLAVSADSMVIETPAAAGQRMAIEAGSPMVCAMTIGQNRWLFQTTSLGARAATTDRGVESMGLALAMPHTVERCTRREFLRASVASLNLPEVRCWPLLNPATAGPAELANRELLRQRMGGGPAASDPGAIAAFTLPEVGPSFPARLTNISGGGVGLVVVHEHAPAAQRQAHLWLNIDLAPHIPAPIALMARRVHSHIDSSQSVYLGMAFEFSHGAGHQRFITDLLSGYAREIQRLQAPKNSEG